MPLMHSLTRTALLAGVLLLTKGCSALLPQQTLELPDNIEACQAFLARIDQAIEADGVTDGASFRIEGFAYLRTNRFLYAAGERLVTRDQSLAWLEAMHKLDRQARRKEILNLAPERFQEFKPGTPTDEKREALIGEVSGCAQTLYRFHRYETDLRERVRRRTVIPDEYRTWRRALGLYPLLALPVAYVTDDVYDDFRQWHETPPDELSREGQLVVAGPAEDLNRDGFDPQSLYRPERMNALGMPTMTAAEGRRLAAYFAPIIIQDEADRYDRIGTLIWQDDRVQIATGHPTVYYYFSYAIVADRPALQINYAFWYSHRDGRNAPWIERGPLDGITVRISFDHRMQPFMVDLMNNCGCYHFFIPQRRYIQTIRGIPLAVDPFVPAWMPSGFPDNRLQLRVNSGWHQVQHVGAGEPAEVSRVYTLVPYEELEMLPDETGRSQSIFDAHGIARDSERIEPLIFFSMGIPAVGSMRQRGHHAIKLVGRAYFDDPLLFEQSFAFAPGAFGFKSQTLRNGSIPLIAFEGQAQTDEETKHLP